MAAFLVARDRPAEALAAAQRCSRIRTSSSRPPATSRPASRSSDEQARRWRRVVERRAQGVAIGASRAGPRGDRARSAAGRVPAAHRAAREGPVSDGAPRRNGDLCPAPTHGRSRCSGSRRWRARPASVGDWASPHDGQLMLEHDPNYAGTHFALGLVRITTAAPRPPRCASSRWPRRRGPSADKDLAELKTMADLRR